MEKGHSGKLRRCYESISVEFPDLPGCLTCGSSEDEAISMAKEAMLLHLYGMEEDGDSIPEASKITSLNLESNQFVMRIEAWMVPYRDKMANKAVPVNIIVPKWLKSYADRRKVNYSHILTEALKGYLGVKDPASFEPISSLKDNFGKKSKV